VSQTFYYSAKGRTNVELREQFTLAAGVSQSMTPFKTKPSLSGQSPDASVSGSSGQRLSMSGPITKVNFHFLCFNFHKISIRFSHLSLRKSLSEVFQCQTEPLLTLQEIMLRIK